MQRPFARQFSYQEQRGKGIANITSRWVSQIAYIDNTASVELIFAPAIIPLITRLEEQFTSYELQQIKGLSTAYAIRLYELLIAWRSTGKTPIIETQELRRKLGVLDGEYKMIADFKKRVFEPSIKQINEHTDITVKSEQHKTGRSITGFSFRFKQKAQPKLEQKTDPKRDPNTPDFFVEMTDAQRHLFGNKLAHDARVQSEYSHLIGTGSYEDFAKLLADMLAEEQHFKMFYPLLVEHGYKA